MTELDRRTLLTAGLAGGGLLVTGVTGLAAPAAAKPRIGKTLARGLRVPWGLAFLPSGDALVGERNSGRVFRVSRRGGKKLVGTVPDVVGTGEGGLLGMVCSPTFRRDRTVYAYLSHTDGDNRIVKMRFAKGVLGAPENVLTGIPWGRTHDGGGLAFGPDGMLYVSTGDTDTGSLSQDLDSLAGKILRITADGDVPADNPFEDPAAAPAKTPVWTYGHRNVQGITFDQRGRLWATELGEHTRDELNRIRKGRDYGWPDVEGGDGDGPVHDPFVVWQPTSTCSPSGVAVVKGKAYVGALAGRALMRVDLNGTHKRRKRRYLHEKLGRIRSVQAAPDGSLWVTTSNRDGRGDPRKGDDRVVRIRP